MTAQVSELVGELRDFALSIVPGGEVWPSEVVRDLVTRAADRLEELEFEQLPARATP